MLADCQTLSSDKFKAKTTIKLVQNNEMMIDDEIEVVKH